MNNLTDEQLRSFELLAMFCSKFFLGSPDEKTLSGLCEQKELLRDEPFATVCPAQAAHLYDLLDALDSAQKTEDFLCEISQDYTYLFYMVGASRTSPYESVYRTDDRTMFGPTTLEVRNAYHAHGVKVPKEGSEPDDHFGFEMSFVSTLFAKAATAAEQNEAQQLESIMTDAKTFLANHLLVFGPLYLSNVEQKAQSEFFACIARISGVVLESMAHVLEVSPVEELVEYQPESR